MDSRAEVKSFDHGTLKHVETAEKNPLPTQADIKEELRPETLPDVSAVSSFDAGQLKHVETQEKVVLPTADGMFMIEFIFLCVNWHSTVCCSLVGSLHDSLTYYCPCWCYERVVKRYAVN